MNVKRESRNRIITNELHGNVQGRLFSRLIEFKASLQIFLLINKSQPNNPLHGVTLENMVLRLVEYYDWSGLADKIRIHCFQNEPSVKSSLKFLRRTPWARVQVEQLYVRTFSEKHA